MAAAVSGRSSMWHVVLQPAVPLRGPATCTAESASWGTRALGPLSETCTCGKKDSELSHSKHPYRSRIVSAFRPQPFPNSNKYFNCTKPKRWTRVAQKNAPQYVAATGSGGAPSAGPSYNDGDRRSRETRYPSDEADARGAGSRTSGRGASRESYPQPAAAGLRDAPDEKAQSPIGLQKSRGELYIEEQGREGNLAGSDTLWGYDSEDGGQGVDDDSADVADAGFISEQFPDGGEKALGKERVESVTRRKKLSGDEKALLAAAQRHVATCYGCGAALQTAESEAPGYVPLDTYTLKKRHHQLGSVVCTRCRQLSQGTMVPAVGGNGGYGSGKGFVLADDLRRQLAHLRLQKALIVKLVDVVDFNGSFLGRVRDLVGPNPIVLVITKVDLLPEGTNLEAVGDWIIETVMRKKLNVISVHLSSAKAHTGIALVAAAINKERQGAANVGKSAFVSALLEELADREPNAAAARRRKPIASPMPGTTLGPIAIKAFAGSETLFDTAGVHLHHRMAAAVRPPDLPLLAPRRRLRGYVPSPPLQGKGLYADGREAPEGVTWQGGDGGEEEEAGGVGMEGLSLFWGGIVRVDVLQAPPSLRFTFFGATGIRIQAAYTQDAEQIYAREVGKKLVPPGDGGLWDGLPSRTAVQLEASLGSRPTGDIAISGLGWITVSGVARPTAGSTETLEPQGVRLLVHTPRGVEVFVRDAIPVGGLAEKWYRFANLTEEEEISRPQLFFEQAP